MRKDCADLGHEEFYNCMTIIAKELEEEEANEKEGWLRHSREVFMPLIEECDRLS